jgi:hypothetical protein
MPDSVYWGCCDLRNIRPASEIAARAGEGGGAYLA